MIVPMNESIAVTASTGLTSGRMIRKNAHRVHPPSILADSSSSWGPCRRSPSSATCSRRARRPGTARSGPMGVEADRRVLVGDLGEHEVDRHDRQELREHLDEQQGQQAHPTAPEPDRENAYAANVEQAREQSSRSPRRPPLSSGTTLVNGRSPAEQGLEIGPACPVRDQPGGARACPAG